MALISRPSGTSRRHARHRLHAQSGNSVLLSSLRRGAGVGAGVPAAYAFARFKFRLGEDIAFTLLSLPLRAAAAGPAAASLCIFRISG